MNTWRIVFAAAALAGCTGTVGTTPGGTGASSTGATGTGATGTGATGGSSTGGSSTGGTGSTGSAGTGGTVGATCAPGLAATSQITRLTNLQYDRTIRDLLKLTSITASGGVAPSQLLAADQLGELSDLGWSSYQTVAEKIAAQVMADPALKQNFIACDPAAANCLHDTIVSFGRRAFRRPLSAAEIAGFDAIVAKGAQITPTGAPAEVAEALLYMFLVSPSFIQRSEITEKPDTTGHFVLSSHEIAARLSFMLWGTTPDTLLDQAADGGMLTTPAQILTQAQRMLADPKAHDMVAAFHSYYLLMGTNTRWDTPKRDTTMFPTFKPEVVPAMAEEELRFFDSIVFKGGTFQDFLTSPVAFVNSVTAPLYGLATAGFTADFKETMLNAEQRPGFLSRIGFLNAYSGYNRTSPILRGAFIAKQIMGTVIGSPPPGAEGEPLPATADLDTNRKQVDAQTSGTKCQGCHHAYINPPGFVMDAYNAVGTWQTVEAATNVPIDTVVDMTIDEKTVHVTKPAEMMAAIAASPTAQAQYASKWVSYAYERDANVLDCGTVQSLAAKISAGKYPVQTLITDLTQTETFRLRAVEVVQ